MANDEDCENKLDPQVENLVDKMNSYPCRDPDSYICLITLVSNEEFAGISALSVETQAMAEWFETKGYSEDTDLTDKKGETVYLAISDGYPAMPESLKALRDACKYFGENDIQFDTDKDGYRYCIVPHFRKELLKDRLSELCSI